MSNKSRSIPGLTSCGVIKQYYPLKSVSKTSQPHTWRQKTDSSRTLVSSARPWTQTHINKRILGTIKSFNDSQPALLKELGRDRAYEIAYDKLLDLVIYPRLIHAEVTTYWHSAVTNTLNNELNRVSRQDPAREDELHILEGLSNNDERRIIA